MECPNCGSHLYERTPVGWCCSACDHREPLDPTEHILERPPLTTQASGYGSRWQNEASRPTRKPKGDIATYLELRKRDRRRALSYLEERRFSGKDVLNQHYYLAERYLEQGRRREASWHLDRCRDKLDSARDPARVQALIAKLEAKASAHRSHPSA